MTITADYSISDVSLDILDATSAFRGLHGDVRKLDTAFERSFRDLLDDERNEKLYGDMVKAVESTSQQDLVAVLEEVRLSLQDLDRLKERVEQFQLPEDPDNMRPYAREGAEAQFAIASFFVAFRGAYSLYSNLATGDKAVAVAGDDLRQGVQKAQEYVQAARTAELEQAPNSEDTKVQGGRIIKIVDACEKALGFLKPVEAYFAPAVDQAKQNLGEPSAQPSGQGQADSAAITEVAGAAKVASIA